MMLIRAGLPEEKNSLNLVSYSSPAVFVIILVFWQSTSQTGTAPGELLWWVLWLEFFDSLRRKFGIYFLVSSNCVSRLRK